jgi:hypothetical protein
MAVKGFFGLGARTFGNPSGRTPGGGGSTPVLTPLNWTSRGNITGPNEPRAMAVSSGLNPNVALLIDDALNLHRSLNGGRTWAALAPVPPQANFFPGTLAYGAGVWLWVQDAVDQILARSTDNGATWNPVNTNMTAFGGTQYLGTDGAGTWVCWANVVGGANLRFARSTDNGVTFASGPDPLGGGTLTGAPVWTGSEFVAPAVSAALAPIIVTSPNGLVWTALPFTNAAGTIDVVTRLGSLFVSNDLLGPNEYSGASPAGLAASFPNALVPAVLPSNLLFTLGGPVNLYAFDSAGNVANSLDAVTFVLGGQNFPGGETMGTNQRFCTFYDARAQSACVISSAGSVCTFP